AQELGSIGADGSGTVTWPWSTTCATSPAVWLASAIDVATGHQTNQVQQTVTSSQSCVSPVAIQNSPASGPQGTTFAVTGSGFTPGGSVRRLLTAPGQGQQELSSILADIAGNITWSYTSSCQDLTGIWTLSAIDVPKSQTSNVVTQNLTPLASCSANAQIDQANLVSENYADGTSVPSGSSYTQRWVLINSGSTTWDSNYQLEYVSGDAGCPTTPVPVPQSVAPGQTYTFSVICTASSISGSAKQVWQLYGP